jgi:NADPH-dependent 2,4-dienoyl-CoA reductase/sulfur reductase-like enzyme/nitrite reductase/ring-hydroxylating ferredoxin subunit
MDEEKAGPAGPDLTRGVTLSDFVEGRLVGHVGDDEVLVVQTGIALFAIDARCSHYQGPLADGIVDGLTVRCPWHHACFDLQSGEALHAPAFSSVDSWLVELRDDKIFVRQKRKPSRHSRARVTNPPGRIVIIGGGASGFAAAEMLRRQNFDGTIVMLSNDTAAPVDRPNLSKDYLAGNAPDDWLPLRPDTYYAQNHIDLRLNEDVFNINVPTNEVAIAGKKSIKYDRLLLATGAEPVRLNIPGADQRQVHTLRSLADSRAIVEAAAGARRALVIGASFIGLEAAASLRARSLEVHVVAPEARPMERVLGPQIGDFVRSLHEEHGVIFHLQNSVTAIDGRQAMLKSGDVIDADLVVMGVGVRPRLRLVEQAGLTMDRGVAVDAFLETSIPGIFAAGDITRWPDPHSGSNIRVEHWVVAERQGQTAAMNILGMKEPFVAVPFFWSQHYDVPINYVGHAEQWDEIVIEGDIKSKDCILRYKHRGRVLAVASIFRDVASLRAELAMEQDRVP